MKILKRAGTVVLSVILWAIILVAALYAFTTMATRDNQNVANIFGYTPLTVQSDSMVPTFASGDLIFIKKVFPVSLANSLFHIYFLKLVFLYFLLVIYDKF